ncbi:MAG: hypothetical protein QOD82_6654, partial [Pseudonocardiales bacterium]|nr:hypothetical protein [Pseudonocardiales bacterium]
MTFDHTRADHTRAHVSRAAFPLAEVSGTDRNVDQNDGTGGVKTDQF